MSAEPRLSDLAFFVRFARPEWRWGALSFLLTLLAAGAASLVPLGGKLLIDHVVPGRELALGTWADAAPAWLRGAVEAAAGGIWPLVAALAVAGAVAGAGQVGRAYAGLRFRQGVVARLQAALFEHLLRFPPSFFRTRQVGYLMSRATDDVAVLQGGFAYGVADAAARLAAAGFAVAVMLALSVRLTLVAGAFLPLAALASVAFAGRLRRASTGEREAVADVHAGMAEVISGVDVVKAHASEGREAGRVGERVRRMHASRARSEVVELAAGTAGRAAQFASVLAVLAVGAFEMRAGRMSVGDYVAFTTYVVYLRGTADFFASLHLSLQPLLVSAGRVLEMFATVPEEGAAGEGGGDVGDSAGLRAPGGPVRGEVQFEHVVFSHGPGDAPVLEGATFELPAGETTALVGASGAGKTTIANLLLKFDAPRAGRILLDGRDYGGLDTRWLRGIFAVVAQETFLFEASVADNIRYGRPGATDAEVEDAARRAMVHDEILALPRGYRTLVGERGARLSVGQKQRVSIARALLRDPRVLILDEPSAALDPAGEALLIGSLEAACEGRTVLLITHRRSMLAMADRVLVLRSGRVEVRRAKLFHIESTAFDHDKQAHS